MENQSEKLDHQVAGLPSLCLASSRLQFSVHTTGPRSRWSGLLMRWLQQTILWRNPTSPRTGFERLRDVRERQHLLTLSPRKNEALARSVVRASSFADQMNIMTSTDSLSLLLRRLDEIERKLDRMLEEARTPMAIGYSARRGALSRKD